MRSKFGERNIEEVYFELKASFEELVQTQATSWS